MKTYPAMNEQIVGILRMSDKPAVLYAAARIEELEAERDTLVEACEAAMEWAASYPLGKAVSLADRRAAADVYELCCATLPKQKENER